MSRARVRLKASSWSAGRQPHLIHGDLTARNVLVWRGRLRPLDFQDLMGGFDAQDLGITLADLRRHQIDESLVAGIARGYGRLRAWPIGGPDEESTLAAIRSLSLLNFALCMDRPDLADFIEQQKVEIRRWMTGVRFGDGSALRQHR